MLDSRVRAPAQQEDLSEFGFLKFAKTFFQGNITHQYSRRPLRHSLLPLSAPGDKAVSLTKIHKNLSKYLSDCYQAALALWKTILRFMGDLPEPKYDLTERDRTPMMTKVLQC